MPIKTYWPLTENFSGVTSIQANGSDNPGPSPTGAQAPNGIAGRLEIVRDPTGVRGNVMRATLLESDAVTATYHRAEIADTADDLAEYWYSWKMMLDPTWVDFASPFVLMQIHDTPDGGDGSKAPNFLVSILSGHLRCIVPAAALPDEGGDLARVGTAGIVAGRWYDCCLHARWATGASGMREFFFDGVPLYQEYNIATQYTDTVGPYMKLGVYNGLSASAGWVSRIAYYSEVRVWSGAANFIDGMGRSLASPARVALV